MVNSRRGQTATEMVVILSVVMIIIVLVLATFSDITFFRSSDEMAIEQVYFQKQPLGVGKITSSPTNTTMYVWSNAVENITVHNIWFDSTSLELSDVVLSPKVSTLLTTTQITQTSSVLDREEVILKVNFSLDDSAQIFIQTYRHPKKVFDS